MKFQQHLEEAKQRSRGAVFHHYSKVAGKTKYLVTLNHTWPPHDGLVVYAFTTSNAGHFQRARIPEESIVRLDPRDYDFVTVPTVIDLTRPEIEQLAAIVRAPAFRFVTQLKLDHLKAIDDAVRGSMLIPRKLKKLILAGYG